MSDELKAILFGASIPLGLFALALLLAPWVSRFFSWYYGWAMP